MIMINSANILDLFHSDTDKDTICSMQHDEKKSKTVFNPFQSLNMATSHLRKRYGTRTGCSRVAVCSYKFSEVISSNSVFLEKLKDLNDGRKGGVVIRRCQFLIRLSYCPKLILFKCKTSAV